MKVNKAYFLDVDYVLYKGKTYIRLLLKGKTIIRLLYQYDPYFYVDVEEDKVATIEKIHVRRKNGDITSVLKVEKTEISVNGIKKRLLKVFCAFPGDVPLIKQAIPYTCYEYNISFAKRFIIDLQLTPFGLIRYEREGKIIKKIIGCTVEKMPKLSSMAFDIETYNPLGAPREKKDPVIMISFYGRKKGVLTYKKINKEFVESCENEKAIIERLTEIVKEDNPDILFGYNSSNFDLPYLKARAELLNANLILGKKKTELRKIKRGMTSSVRIDGRIHIDLYPAIRFFGFIGLIKAQNFTLEKIYHDVIGKKKLMVKRLNIWELWDKGNLDELAEYSLMDSEATYELGLHFLPLHMELANISKLPLFDLAVSTSGQMVENILMYNAKIRNEIVPARPNDSVVNERLAAPIEGAFVKIPPPGIYENIAVLDFRALYPSIISSYNVDPITLNLGKSIAQDDSFISPTGAKFAKHPRGLIPTVVDWLINYRVEIKKELKKLDKNSENYKTLSARSHAIKICTNTIYGYMGFARSRWYSRECAESTTAWGRKHILEVITKAERAGFNVLYSDTDSVFIIYKNKDDVFKFIDDINKELPDMMELDLEGIYPRGVFVSKKAETRGAKKKYALLSDDGKIKIRGFELVRRDWSEIAKETQLRVLETILREGSKEKAVEIVRKTIQRLRDGEVKMDELAIETQLNKDIGSYEVKSPELGAASNAIKRGMMIGKGSVISFVITKSGKTISEKAELTEFAKDYDIDYYINNQVLPAVMKILKELGYDEHDLKLGGKQRGLGEFI